MIRKQYYERMLFDNIFGGRMNLATELRGRLSLPLPRFSDTDNELVSEEGLLHDFLCFLNRQTVDNRSATPSQLPQNSMRFQNPGELLGWLNLPNTFFMLLQNWVHHQFPATLPLNQNSVLELITLTVELLAFRDQSGRLGDLHKLQQELSTCQTCLLCQPSKRFVLRSSLSVHTILHHPSKQVDSGLENAWYRSVERMQATALDIYRNVQTGKNNVTYQKRLHSSDGGDDLAPSKRGRTRLTNTQLEILRANFNLNNSPTDAKIAEICSQTELEEKVVKHWFRNTLFKERQRSKDSPYNFSIPPTTSLNLEKYEKTGKIEVWPTLTNNKETEEIKQAEEEGDDDDYEDMLSRDIKGYSGSLSDPERSFAASPSSPRHEKVYMQSQNNSQEMLPFFVSSSTPSEHLAKRHNQQQHAVGEGKRIRTAISQSQQMALSRFFQSDPNPSRRQMDTVASTVSLPKRVVQVWFQNARSRERKLSSSLGVSSSSSTTSTKQNVYKFHTINNPSEPAEFSSFSSTITPNSYKYYNNLNLTNSLEHQPTFSDTWDPLTLNNAPTFSNIPYPLPLSIALPFPLSNVKHIIKEPMVSSISGEIKSSTPLLLPPPETLTQNTSEILQQIILPNLLSQFMKTSQASFHQSPKHFPWSRLLPENATSQTSSYQLQSDSLSTSDSPLDLSHNPTKSSSPSPLTEDNGLKVNEDSFVKGVRDVYESKEAAVGEFASNPSPTDKRELNLQTRRNRTSISTLKSRFMQAIFVHHKTPSICECERLGQAIGLTRRVVQVWFQNQRAKEKKMARVSAFSLNPTISSPTTSTTTCESPMQPLLSPDVFITRNNECKICGVVIGSTVENGENLSEGFSGTTENDKVVEHLLSGMHLTRLVETCNQMDV